MWCLLHLTDFYGGSLEKSISLKDIRSSSDQEQLARVSYIDGCLITTQRMSSTHCGTILLLLCLFTIPRAECKITAGHWPISSHFSEMANQNFSVVHSLCTHVPIKFMKNGRQFQVSLFCTLHVCMCVSFCLSQKYYHK